MTPTDFTALVERVLPGARVVSVTPLSDRDADEGDATEKAAGYGVPLKLQVEKRDGSSCELVFHTASANEFGHDWRADRAAEMILAFDTFSEIPDHTEALDVGAMRSSSEFVSLRDTSEFYLLTTFVEGTPYADDLRRVSSTGVLQPQDRARCQELARWLARLHSPIANAPGSYARSLRDVVGSGEGVFGIVDGYPANVPAAPADRLEAIERECVAWRWRVRERHERACRIHGDFHPFNVVFDGEQVHVLDASRGSIGDPANDVTCMAVNYIFFALDHPTSWQSALRELWFDFWNTYAAERADEELRSVLAPYLVWRLLVLCNPVWYPALALDARDRMLSFAERVLAEERFDPVWADEIFVAGRAS